jgi:MbtH protein
MATNPFEDEEGVYRVLVNAEGQHSLWPAAISVPEGWDVAHQDDTRAACLAYIEENWTDMRPKSLIQFMNEHASQ